MNTVSKYVPRVGDRVELKFGDFGKGSGGQGEVVCSDASLEVARILLDTGKVTHRYFEDLQFIRRAIKPKCSEDTEFKLSIQGIESTEQIDEQEPIELDHLCMPTTQDEIEPIDKGEVVEEVGKFLKLLKSKGWSLDSLNLELCSKNDEEDYVIVNL